jgi:atypical dual specificity phosphatase
MHRFYWIIDGVLAGCSRPGANGGDLDADLRMLRGHGIGALLTLTETPLTAGALERHGLRGLHLPVDDFHAPTPGQLLEALAFIDEAQAAGIPTAVHCLAGMGRTGTALAAYLIRGGLPAPDAIASIRAVCPGAIEERRQVEALETWALERSWLI